MVIISEPRPGLVFQVSVGAVVEEKGVEKARLRGGWGVRVSVSVRKRSNISGDGEDKE